jgi:hypothetical protein
VIPVGGALEAITRVYTSALRLGGSGLDQEPDEGTPRTRTRRIVAFLVVLAGVGLVIASYYVDDLGICRAQPSGDEQTCEPLGVAHLIPFLIVALALMWPEWSELGIGGVISIKKALERQAERQERLQEAVVNLQQQLSQTTTVHNYIYPPDLREFQEKERRFEKGPAKEEGPAKPEESARPKGLMDLLAEQVRPERLQLEAQFLAVWSELNALAVRSWSLPSCGMR